MSYNELWEILVYKKMSKDDLSKAIANTRNTNRDILREVIYMNSIIKTGNCIVITSGLVVSFNGEPIEIDFESSSNERMKLVFAFKHDISIAGQSMNASVIPNSIALQFDLTNFNNPLGTGTIKPIQFARDKYGKNLFINFSVYVIGESSPSLQYTIYREV